MKKAIRNSLSCVRSVLFFMGVLLTCGVHAQFGIPGPGGPGAEPVAARQAAPIDLTGTWVSIVNEDWRWRMVTPEKGDTSSIIMLNARGREVANQWDESMDGSCKAFGAAGLMRMPTRLRISWDDDNTMRLETDAGRQTRILNFMAPDDNGEIDRGAPSLQGYSLAQWKMPVSYRPGPNAEPPQTGSLEVVTTNLLPAWLRRNGVPYSAQTRLSEYFDRFAAPNGDEWLVVTSVVEDPVYLNRSFITSSHFKREADNANWNPKACNND